jgi:hypothetical protein
MAIEANETLIRGGSQSVEGRMVPDASLVRIRVLIDTRLEKSGALAAEGRCSIRMVQTGVFGSFSIPRVKFWAEGQNQFVASTASSQNRNTD